jgi:hypothetical protein
MKLFMKLFIILSIILQNFVIYSQNNLGKTFDEISKNKFVTEIDTTHIPKYVVRIPNNNVTVINFFNSNNISDVVSVTYKLKEETMDVINILDNNFIKFSNNSWQILENVYVKFEDDSFYYFWKAPLKINFIK